MPKNNPFILGAIHRPIWVPIHKHPVWTFYGSSPESEGHTPVILGTAAVTSILKNEQYLHPSSDNTDGTWLPSTGTELYSCVDELIADSSDYIYSTSGGACSPLVLNIEPPTEEPLLERDSHRILVEAWSDDPGATFKVSALSDSTVVAYRYLTNVPETKTIYEWLLTNEEASDISDYTSLQFKVEKVNV